MKIEVTQEDINKGEVTECRRCPIALAVIRATGNKYVLVDSDYTHVGTKFCPTPVTAKRFIRNFDYGNDVQPFTFELPI